MKIPATIVVYSGQEQDEVLENLFGSYPDPDYPAMRHHKKIHEFDGGEIEYKRGYIRDTVGAAQDTFIVIDIVRDTAIAIIGAYLYDKLCNFKKAKLLVNGKDINIIKEEIQKAIKEEFDKMKQDSS